MSSDEDTFVPPDGAGPEPGDTKPDEPKPEPESKSGKGRHRDTADEEQPDDSTIYRCTGCDFATRYKSQLETMKGSKDKFCPSCHSKVKRD